MHKKCDPLDHVAMKEILEDYFHCMFRMPDPRHVAEYAARWAGMDSACSERISEYEAKQRWRPPQPDQSYNPVKETAEERRQRKKRWREDDKAARRNAKEQADERLTNA
jgi:hypothetical protein